MDLTTAMAPLAMFPFPEVNASLNGISALLLMAAYVCIRKEKITAHAALMITALVTSTLFLASYLTFHYYRLKHGIAVTRYPDGGALKPVYLAILATHTVLAVVTVPLVLVTVWRANKRRFKLHRKIAVWTLPIWLYVSVTGVVIYWMLAAVGAYGK